MKNKFFYGLVLMIMSAHLLNAQNKFPSKGSTGIGTVTPHASAILDIDTTGMGILIPRMNKNQRDGINSPALGLLIYQTDNTAGFYYYDGSQWTAMSSKDANKSLSNLNNTSINKSLLPNTNNSLDLGSSTNAWKNIYASGNVGIGTTPNYKLDVNGDINIPAANGFRIGGFKTLSIVDTASLFIGWFSGQSSTSGSNTFLGYASGSSNTTGNYNTATGSSTLWTNTTGTNNTVLGHQGLYLNSTGSHNTATGAFSLYSNTTGNYNTANGSSALYSNTTGGSNTGIGYRSLYSNTSGNNNTASGYLALNSNTTGSHNTATGYSALFTNNTGGWNTASGIQALYYNTTGNSNTASGSSALYANTSGSMNCAIGTSSLFSNTIGSYNVANGYQALYRNTTGSANTAVGYLSLYFNSSGNNNTILGCEALFSNQTGNNNIAIGYRAGTYCGSDANHNLIIGYSAGENVTNFGNVLIGELAGNAITSGMDNTLIGKQTNTSAATITNSTALGNGALVNATNKIRFGNSAVTIVEGQVSYTVSDGRFKSNITEDIKGLDFINKLRPVVYNFNAKKFDEFLHKKDLENFGKSSSNIDYSQAEKIRYSGFIAQEVEEAAKESGYDFNGVHVPQNEDDNYSLAYGEFVVPLVKAVQELDAKQTSKDDMIAQQQTLLEAQQQQIGEQQLQIDELNSKLEKLQSAITNSQAAMNDGAVKITTGTDAVSPLLGQNIPNPFDNTTVIPFRIPKGCSSASLVITESVTGRMMTAIPVSCDETQMVIEAGSLASGTYVYTLLIDGKEFDSKRMVIAK